MEGSTKQSVPVVYTPTKKHKGSRDGSTKKHVNEGDLSTMVIPTFFPNAPEIPY